MEKAPKRRWQFSLRAVLLLTAAVSVGLAWWVSGDRIPRNWELATIYEAATNSGGADEEYLLTWCIETDDRPLLVERCIVLSHRADRDGGGQWHICELYRHPDATTPAWNQSMIHWGPSADDRIGHWEIHTKRFDQAPTNTDVYKFLEDIGWNFGPSKGFKIIDAGVCPGRWQQALKEAPTRRFE